MKKDHVKILQSWGRYWVHNIIISIVQDFIYIQLPSPMWPPDNLRKKGTLESMVF